MSQARSPLESFLWAEGRLDAKRQRALDQLRWGSPDQYPDGRLVIVDVSDFSLVTSPILDPEHQQRLRLPQTVAEPLPERPLPEPTIILCDADGHRVGDYTIGNTGGIGVARGTAYLHGPEFRTTPYLPQIALASGHGLPASRAWPGPVDLQVDSTAATALVTHRWSGAVHFLNLVSGSIVSTLRLRPSGRLEAMPIAWDGDRIFVAPGGGEPLWVYDLFEGRAIEAIEGLGTVTNVALDPDGRSLWVLAAAPKFALHRVNLNTLRLDGTIALPGESFRTLGDTDDLMALSPDGSRLLVMGAGSDPEPETPVVLVLNLSTGRMIRRMRFRAGRKPAGLAFAGPNPYFCEPRPLEESLVELRIVTWEELVTIKDVLSLAGEPEPDAADDASPSLQALAGGERWRDATVRPAERLSLPAGLDALLATFLGKIFHEQTGLTLPEHDEAIENRLLAAAANARKHLETHSAAEVDLPEVMAGRGLRVTITREQLAEWRHVLQQLEVVLIESADEAALTGPPDDCPACDKRLQGQTTCPACGLVLEPAEADQGKSPRWLREGLTQATLDPCLFLPFGHLLLPDPVRQRVIELDHQSRVCWEIHADRFHDDLKDLLLWPLDALRLANGNTLILDRMAKRLYEVTPDGRPYWEWPHTAGPLIEPVRVARNEWGETHVVDRLAHRVRRVDANGRAMAGYGSGEPGIGPGELFMPGDIHVLLNGHMLITDTGNHRVIEVADGEIVWQFGNRYNVFQDGADDGPRGLHTPRRAIRLSGGRTAILDSGNHRLIIVDAQGQVTWSCDTLALPDELRMESPLGMQRVGHDQFAIWDNRAVIQVDAHGNVVWAALLAALAADAAMLAHRPERRATGADPRRLWHVRQRADDSPEQIAVASFETERRQAVQPIKKAWFEGLRQEAIRLMKELSKQRLAALSKAKPWRIDLDSLQARTARVREHLRALARSRQEGRAEPPPPPPAAPSPPPVHQVVAPAPTKPAPEAQPKLGLDRPPFLALAVQRTRHRVVLVDRQQDILWAWGSEALNMPQSASLLENGQVLIADSGNDRLIVIDPNSGDLVWESPPELGLKYPRAAQRLANGHTLIADSANRRLLEIDSEGSVVWRWTGRELGTPAGVQRLADGRTLVADWGHHVVWEVDEAGDIVWSYGRPKRWGSQPGMLHHPETATRLPNGHTLVCDGRNQRVIEVTPEGETVWQGEGLAGPTDARRLVDGATLITYSGGHLLVEMGPDAEVLWRMSLSHDG